MDPALLSLLRCPSCSATGLAGTPRRIICPACGRSFGPGGEFIDLIDPAAEPTASSAEQRFMESELVANVYERVWRPSFVRVMAGRGASASTGGFAGEFFIHKNCLAMDDRDGPWLDLSCGPGLFTRAMAAAAPGSHIIGLDISRAMLEVAARRAQGYTNVTFIRADAHHLPIADASLGGVNSSGALHAYDDPERAFGEIVRVLRPGGVFVASTFARANSLLGRAAAHLGGIRRYDSLRLRAQLARIGLIDYEEVVFGGSLIFRVRRP